MKKREHNSKRKTYVMVISLIIIFCIIISLIWFFSTRYSSNETVTSFKKQSIKPPIKFSHLVMHNKRGIVVPHSQWRDKWVLLYIAPLPCKKLCTQNLYKLQQIYNASTEKSRLDIMVATFSAAGNKQLEELLSRYTHFVHVYLQRHNFLRVFAHVKLKRATMFMGVFYLVNPHGEVIMNYPENIAARVIEFDLFQPHNRVQK